MKKLSDLIFAGFIIVGIVGIASAIPQLINYQGFLTDDGGNPVADGNYSLTFRIWDAETGPNQLWSEDHPTVSVTNGLFNVILGSMSPLELPFDTDYWLGVQVEGEPELPRIRLTSVAYSYRADMADTAVSAFHAAYADSAGLVEYADSAAIAAEADHAATADNALFADSARATGPVVYSDTSSYSFHALRADSAAHSVHADTASWTLGGGGTAWADTAGYAFRADTSNYALSAPAAPDDDWVISGSNIYRLDGNVGIGLTSPSTKLDVRGDINTDSLYKIGGAAVVSVLGTENILVGVDAGANNAGSYGTFVGYHAGYNNQANYNTFLGHSAGFANTTGWGNTFLGRGAGWANGTGNSNTFLGYGVGYFNTTGNSNTFVGGNAGYRNTEGSSNTFLGTVAGHNNTTGHNNTFVGASAGYSNSEGTNNTFLGATAGHNNTTGYSNTFLGNIAGQNNTTGNNNTFLGYVAGFNNTRGRANTFLGYSAGFSDSTGNNNVFIGFEAGYFETGSNKLYIANGRDTADVLIYGDFTNDRVGINTTSPGYTLDVNGDINVAGSYNVKKGGVDYNHPDYVFEPDYKLMPLDELREYVCEHKSLPNVISAEEVKKNDGFKMDELLIQMLEKIEEQTLYILQLEERITELERKEMSVTKGGD